MSQGAWVGYADDVKVDWVAPTLNADGFPLDDLDGFELYCGTSSGVYDPPIDVGMQTSYTCRNLPQGQTYYWAVKAYDRAGNRSVLSEEKSYWIEPNDLPAVSLTRPTDDTIIMSGYSLLMRADASDPDGSVERVEFLSNGSKVGEATTSPYSFTWQNVPRGHFRMSARVVDNRGGTATTPQVDVIIVQGVPTAWALEQDPGPDGIVSFEAEDYDYRASTKKTDWDPVSVSGSSGGAMSASPNAGKSYTKKIEKKSPRLSYSVYFHSGGTYYVWARGLGASSSDDSFHVGLDGAVCLSSDRITGFGSSWTWSRSTEGGPVATIYVPTAGIHEIDVWAMEDGFILDKLVLTSNSGYTPSGVGPASSPLSGPWPLVPEPFRQDSNWQGLLSMEAENCDQNSTRMKKYSWACESRSGASGSSAMSLNPNKGKSYETGYRKKCPRLDFEAVFVKTGTHYVWARGMAATSSDDGFHVGLNGNEELLE